MIFAWDSRRKYIAGTTLEDTYVKATFFKSISSGTTGTVGAPVTGALFILDEWSAGVDALVSKMVSGKPTFESPKDAGGNVITATFNATGDYTLSGTPTAYPVALFYVYRCRLKYFDYSKTLFESELSVEAGGGLTLIKKTGNYTIQAADLNGDVIICNEGAVGDIVLTLPALTDGDKIGFLVTEPHYIRVNVNGVEVFNYGGTDGAAGGYVRSNTPGTQWDITAVAKWYLGQIAGYIKYDE